LQASVNILTGSNESSDLLCTSSLNKLTVANAAALFGKALFEKKMNLKSKLENSEINFKIKKPKKSWCYSTPEANVSL
jgi:hypothetical protein